MKKSFLLFAVLAAFTLVGCTTDDSTAGMQSQGSGVRDASDINAGAATGAAAGPIGHPGR